MVDIDAVTGVVSDPMAGSVRGESIEQKGKFGQKGGGKI